MSKNEDDRKLPAVLREKEDDDDDDQEQRPKAPQISDDERSLMGRQASTKQTTLGPQIPVLASAAVELQLSNRRLASVIVMQRLPVNHEAKDATSTSSRPQQQPSQIDDEIKAQIKCNMGKQVLGQRLQPSSSSTSDKEIKASTVKREMVKAEDHQASSNVVESNTRLEPHISVGGGPTRTAVEPETNPQPPGTSAKSSSTKAMMRAVASKYPRIIRGKNRKAMTGPSPSPSMDTPHGRKTGRHRRNAPKGVDTDQDRRVEKHISCLAKVDGGGNDESTTPVGIPEDPRLAAAVSSSYRDATSGLQLVRFEEPQRNEAVIADTAVGSDIDRPGAYYGQGASFCHVHDAEEAAPPSTSLELSQEELAETVLQGYYVNTSSKQRNRGLAEAALVGMSNRQPPTDHRSKRRILYVALVGLIVIVGVVVGVVVASSGDGAGGSFSDTTAILPEATTSPEEEEIDIGSLPLDEVVATVPIKLCKETYPGAGQSKSCSANDTMPHGGAASNLVALAFHAYAPPGVDIVLLNAGALDVDINVGEFRVQDALLLLPYKAPLIILDMTGEEIMSLVRYTIDLALHEDACSCVYPYASGLRFDVNATSRDPENAFNFETLMDGKWIEVDSNRTFSLMGYFVDIHVGPRAYNQFVDEKLVTESTYSPTDLFLQYAIEKGVLEEPSKEEYSTKSYIPNE
jgi:hypothetical protein